MSDWAEKAMRGELGDSHYGRDPAGDFSEAEPIAVTEEMIAAGLRTWSLSSSIEPGAHWIACIYRAMAAIAPSDAFARGSQQAAQFRAERDAALEPKPEPPHDWTREFTGDRRRVGG